MKTGRNADERRYRRKVSKYPKLPQAMGVACTGFAQEGACQQSDMDGKGAHGCKLLVDSGRGKAIVFCYVLISGTP